MAILRFSPPFDGTYKFSVTCGGCTHRVTTEKHHFVAGTRAIMRIVSQPSGSTSGSVLEHQPEVQLEDGNGRPLREKVEVVANIVPAGSQSNGNA